MNKPELDYYEDVVTEKKRQQLSRFKESHITKRKHPRQEGHEIKEKIKKQAFADYEDSAERE